ncbi:uncharacterized protein MEPE_00079 [Melanopsichium pennsylvanicum]|uniref:Hikeshi-like domain-containing protein n=1 Tax=Melanopsichium pennsylvanicum TaxID=63383 RepID=A0AAJ5C2F7_9BASI|nr:uncharacterized protein MEPE_00079 [Melanopsichium pennsylvanicum]
MFSVVLPGRLPLTNPQQVDETHLVFPLENASSLNHVVVFMTGIQPFPPGYGATVHLNWPSSSSSSSSSSSNPGTEWKLLGCLKNTKPSAIFKVSKPNTLPLDPTCTANLGISIEPDSIVDTQIASLQQSQQHQNVSIPQTLKGIADTNFGLNTPGIQGSELTAAALQLAPKVAKNAFAYLSSFAPDSAPQTVPLLQKWLEQLERKLRANGVGWLDKQE